MKTVLVVLLIVCSVGLSQSTDKVVCYYSSWAIYRPGSGSFSASVVDPTLCTHFIYAFVGASSTGNVRLLDSFADITLNGINQFLGLRSRNPNAKYMVAIGGWNEGSTQYSTICASASLRTTFVNSVMSFLNQYGFDGLDFDWEYPSRRGGSAADRANLILCLQELKSALSSRNKLLSMAVAAAYQSYSDSYNVPQMSQYLDFINIMAYDFHMAGGAVVGHHAALYRSAVDSSSLFNTDNAISAWINAGAPPAKIVLGIPFYGRAYSLVSTASTNIGAYSSGPGSPGPYTQEAGFLGYQEICENINQGGWTTVTDKTTQSPYSYKGNQWVGYDNVQSVKQKANYAKVLNLGGVMVWAMDTDDTKNICGQGTFPLLRAINTVIPANTNPGTGTTSTQAPTTTTTTSTGSTDCPYYCTQKDHKYFVDSNNRNIFYYCGPVGNGICDKIKFTCQTNLVYYENLQRCDYP